MGPLALSTRRRASSDRAIALMGRPDYDSRQPSISMMKENQLIITKKQVAAQLYTVRDYLKTPAEIAASLKKLKRIGYEAVQLSGLGPIETTDLKKILDDTGVIACSSHDSGDELFGNVNEVIDRLSMLGIKSTAYPYPAGVDFSSIAGVRALAKKLDKAGEALRKAGITLTYHNHHIEFVRIKDKTVLELLYEMTDPENLQGEIDTYWVQAGGGDPVQWIKNMKKRLPLLHMKDYGMSFEKKQPVFEEIGSGNLDWPTIVKAAKASGCEWYIVEQDRDHEKDDPFKSLKMSFDFIAKNLCKE
jgi:sugar phosphate isomerase/epimerase